MEEPGWGTDWSVGSETPVLEAEIRLETAISAPRTTQLLTQARLMS